MQVVYLLRDKVPAGNSTAVLFVKFFAYQLSFVLCTVASLIYVCTRSSRRKAAAHPDHPRRHRGQRALDRRDPAAVLRAGAARGDAGALSGCSSGAAFSKSARSTSKKVRGFENDFASYTEKFRHKKRYYVYAVLLSIPQVICR